MEPAWHGFWTYVLFRRKPRDFLILALIGAFLPDIANGLSLAYNFLIHGFKWEIFISSYNNLYAEIYTYLAHSMLVISLLFLIFYYLNKKILPLFYGMGFHAVLDYVTHHSDGYMPFYPLFKNIKIISPISYWEEGYHSYELMVLNSALAVFFMIYLISRVKRISHVDITLFSLLTIYSIASLTFFIINNHSHGGIINGVIPTIFFIIFLAKGILFNKKS